MRELSGLPAIVPESEKALHVTPEELETMDDESHDIWAIDALNWLINNPDSTLDSLVDLRDDRDDKYEPDA